MSKPSSEQLVNAVFPTWEQRTSSEEIGPAQYLQIRIAVLRSLAVISLAFIPTSILAKALLMILGLIWAVGSSKKIHQNMWVSVSPEMCVIHKGWLSRKRSMFSFRQLQRVSLHQNRVMKQRGVAHITMTTAAGNQLVRYINEEDAIRLYNWSLYCIERSHEDWM
jgi:putative membrane protein